MLIAEILYADKDELLALSFAKEIPASVVNEKEPADKALNIVKENIVNHEKRK